MHITIYMEFEPEDLCRFFKEQSGKQDIDCSNVKKFLDVFYDVFIEEHNFDIKIMNETKEELKYFLVYGRNNSFIIIKMYYSKNLNVIQFVFIISTDYIWKLSSLINILGKYAKNVNVT